jgi:hypothetical protein
MAETLSDALTAAAERQRQFASRRPAPEGSPLSDRVMSALAQIAQPIIETPGRTMTPNPYPEGSELSFAYEDKRSRNANVWAGERAVDMIGASLPFRVPGTLGSGAIQPLRGAVGGPWEGGIRAYHSSPHDFEKVDFSKLRTGEGANSYGAGHYMAENPAVSGQGGQYWGSFLSRFNNAPEGEAARVLMANKFDHAAALDAVEGKIKGMNFAARNGTQYQYELGSRSLPFDQQMAALVAQRDLLKGGQPVGPRTYEMNLRAKPEELLDWDKPLKGQPVAENIRSLVPRDLRGAFDANVESGIAGSNVYHNYIPGERFSVRPSQLEPYATTGAKTMKEAVEVALGNPGNVLRIRDPVHVSQTLADAGIPGIRYLDEGSRLYGDAANMSDLKKRADWFRAKLDAEQHPVMREDLQKRLAGVEKIINTPLTYNYVGTDPSKLDIFAKYGVSATPLGALALQERDYGAR